MEHDAKKASIIYIVVCFLKLSTKIS